MPIVQYHKRPARIDAGLPELGRIYKGAPRQSDNQKQIPADLDHFRFEGNGLPTVTADDVNAAWDALYGEQPRIIHNVQFAIDRLDVAFDSWMEEWGKSRNGSALLNRRCDGQTVIFERDGDKVYRDPVACEHKCQCKPTGRLRMFLPELCARLGVLGTVTLITHASTDIDNIANSLNLVYTQTGRLRNVAFVMYRETVQLMSPVGLPVKKSIVRLELDTRSAQAVASLAAGEALTLPAVSAPRPIENRPALPAPQFATEFDKFDENGDDLPEPGPPTKGVTEEMPPDLYDDEPEQEAPPERMIGTAKQIEISFAGKGRSYALRLDTGAKIPLMGFDGIRAISEWWAACADTWKEMEPEHYRIPPVRVFTSSKGLRFDAEPQPSTAAL
jgi:hypothetical protein